MKIFAQLILIIILISISLYLYYYYRFNKIINSKYGGKIEAKWYRKKFFKIYNYTFIPMLFMLLIIYFGFANLETSSYFDKAHYFAKTIMIFYSLRFSLKLYPSFRNELDELKNIKD